MGCSSESGRNAILYGTKGEFLSNEATSIDEGGLNWFIRSNPVDCIVITGDFFFRGNFDTKTKEKLKSFLQTIYQICSDAGRWGWNLGEPMRRIFWCPGNHDLRREAVTVNNGIPLYRRDRIYKVSNEGYFDPKESRDLFTEQTFREIYTFMCELRGDTLNPDMYETQIFQVPERNSPPVYFLAINTALLAGQVSCEVTDKDVETAYETFFKCHNAHDSEHALAAYQKYHKYLHIREGKEIADEGKLCFISEESTDRLHTQLAENGRGIVVLMGHHPYDFLDQPAQNRFRNFVQQNAIKLYLHGHTHIIQSEAPSGKRNPLLTRENPIRCIGVGGLYLNSQDSYNQLSFALGSINAKEDGRMEYSITMLVFSSASFSDRQWLKVVSPIYCDCPISSPDRLVSVKLSMGNDQLGGEDSKEKSMDSENQNKVVKVAEMNKPIETDIPENLEIERRRIKEADGTSGEDDSEYSQKQIDRLINMIKERKNGSNQ